MTGEVSGDNLAAQLVNSLQNHFESYSMTGIAGPKLQALGAHSLFPMEKLAVTGLIEPLSRIPELYRIRRALINYFLENKPDFFLGVDAPDFNLGLERRLKSANIRTVHYVSPSVWAWRKSRIKLIIEAVDLMLVLFPFEEKFYRAASIPVCFTGHPLADEIPLEYDLEHAKQNLGFSSNSEIMALLPGSRNNELQYMGAIYFETAKLCYRQNKNLNFLMPVVNEKHRQSMEALRLKIAPELPVQISVGSIRSVLQAADAVLVTSGTATLEVLLHKKPMIVAYRMHPLTYQIAKRLVKLPYISLPNLLAEENLVPEYIQTAATPLNLSRALLQALDNEVMPAVFKTKNIVLNGSTKNWEAVLKRFSDIHRTLKCNAAMQASTEILNKILEK